MEHRVVPSLHLRDVCLIILKVISGITILSRGCGGSDSDFGCGGVSFHSSSDGGVLTFDFSRTWRQFSSHLREQCLATVSSQENRIIPAEVHTFQSVVEGKISLGRP